MRIALAQTGVVQGDFEKNIELINDAARRAKKGGAQLVVFPEMFVCGFDYKKNSAFLKANKISLEKELGKIAKSNDIALCGSIPHLAKANDLPTNRLVLIGADSKEIAHYDKIHLFRIFNEDKFVKAGDDIVVSDTPFGKMGFAVCYDLRFPDIFVRMAKRGAKIIIISAAFPHPRSEHWRILSRARAIENQCFVIAVNRGGSENFGDTQVRYFGLSAAIDPWGGILAECGEDASDAMAFADINIDEVENIRGQIPAFADRRDDIY